MAELVSSGSKYGPVADSSGDGNKIYAYTKSEELLQQLKICSTNVIHNIPLHHHILQMLANKLFHEN
jgi:hypothetical protein